MKTELKNWIENYNNTKCEFGGHITGKVVKLKDAPYTSHIHLITKKNTLYIHSCGFVKDYQIDSGNFNGAIDVIQVNSLRVKEMDENTEVFLCEMYDEL